MKLRIESQTLRLRLAPEDVAELGRSGRVSGAIAFPPAGERRLVYELVVSATVEAPSARLADERITVVIPASAAHTLTDTELVGIEERVSVGAAAELLLVVEKDLKPRRTAERLNARLKTPPAPP